MYKQSGKNIKPLFMLENMSFTGAFEKTVNTILSVMSTMDDLFYLTGSRFFGASHKGSDWDFFVRSDYSLKSRLSNLGFREISCQEMIDLGYDQSQFSTIMEYTASDGVIQIQIVKNVGAKQTVQNLIMTDYRAEFNNMAKAERKKLWSLLLKAAGHGM